MYSKSRGYKQGFKKGIEISNNNRRQYGYFADEENEKTIKDFQKQTDEGFDKNGNNLTYDQIQWCKGVVDGIKHRNGTGYCFKDPSPFEQRLNQHYYGR